MLGVLRDLFGGKPTNVPVAMGLIANIRLFRILCYQTIPGGT